MLKGSEKQVKYAEDINKELEALLNNAIDYCKTMVLPACVKDVEVWKNNQISIIQSEIANLKNTNAKDIIEKYSDILNEPDLYFKYEKMSKWFRNCSLIFAKLKSSEWGK
jgi:hypothetical protein